MIEYLPTNQMLADILMKGLPSPKVKILTKKPGIYQACWVHICIKHLKSILIFSQLFQFWSPIMLTIIVIFSMVFPFFLKPHHLYSILFVHHPYMAPCILIPSLTNWHGLILLTRSSAVQSQILAPHLAQCLSASVIFLELQKDENSRKLQHMPFPQFLFEELIQ